jgi:hypothetical protein
MAKTGIDRIPVGGVIYVENLKGFFTKISDTGINNLTTINQAITLGNLVATDQFDQRLTTTFAPEDIVRHNTYAEPTRGGSIKVRLDITNPTKPILYMSTDGTNP